MKGLILSGGTGTRLRPLTHTSNKHLLPLANKPMIHYAIETLKEAGITDIGIIVGHTPQRIQEIKDAIGDGSKFGIKATYIEQDAARGLAHAVATGKEFLTTNNSGGKFVVHLGDNILRGGIKNYVDYFSTHDVDGHLLLKEVTNPERFGVVEVNNGKIIRLVEKPKTPISNLALVGIYFLNNSIFDSIATLKPSWRNEYEITDAIQGLLTNEKKVTYEIVGAAWWKDPGDREGIVEANRLLLHDLVPFNRGIIEEGANVIGQVGIDEGSIIKSGSSVRGPVVIGKNCVIGEKTYIGPYTSIGDNCVIENTEIESSVLIGDSKISCGQRIIDSLIGKNVTIVSSADSLPKACQVFVGENSFIAL